MQQQIDLRVASRHCMACAPAALQQTSLPTTGMFASAGAEASSEPLALTPVLMSPTRSTSPATVVHIGQSQEALQSAISANVGLAPP